MILQRNGNKFKKLTHASYFCHAINYPFLAKLKDLFPLS